MLTMRQAVCVLAMFLFGSAAITGMSSEVAQDVWISLLLAPVLAIPFLMVHGRLRSLYPGKDLFQLGHAMLGKIPGKVVAALMTWYSLHLCALVLRNYSEFVEISVMPETPQLPIALIMLLVVVYLLKSGIETMGKSSICMLPIVLFIILLTIVLSLNRMDFTRIMPILSHGIGPIVKSSYPMVSFPYLETVVFLCAIPGISKPYSPYKLYIYAVLIATASLLSISLRNLFLLGPQLVDSGYFPSYIAVKVIYLGDIISRIEGSIAMNFVLGGVLKTSVCLLAAAKGTAYLFGLRNYKQVLMPLGLLAVGLSSILYKNSIEMYGFIKIYMYYAFPFQVIIPLLIWIVAEFKARKNRPEKPSETST